MQWLILSLVITLFYIFYFGKLIRKKQYSRLLYYYCLAHIPYLLINLVAPFRGLLDKNYAGYTLGLLDLPKGPIVFFIVGAVVVSCFYIASNALKNTMENKWLFAFVLDLFLVITAAIPIFYSVIIDPISSSIKLGEFLSISGIWVAVIVFSIFSAPSIFALFISSKKTIEGLKN